MEVQTEILMEIGNESEQKSNLNHVLLLSQVRCTTKENVPGVSLSLPFVYVLSCLWLLTGHAVTDLRHLIMFFLWYITTPAAPSRWALIYIAGKPRCISQSRAFVFILYVILICIISSSLIYYRSWTRGGEGTSHFSLCYNIVMKMLSMFCPSFSKRIPSYVTMLAFCSLYLLCFTTCYV